MMKSMIYAGSKGAKRVAEDAYQARSVRFLEPLKLGWKKLTLRTHARRGAKDININHIEH